MKSFDFKGIMSAISEASPSHLALVSFLLLPVVLNYWLDVWIEFFPSMTLGGKVFLCIVLIVIYLTCLIWLLVENKRKRQLETYKNIVMGRLIANNWKSMSFDSARKVLGNSFTDEQFAALIEAFPDTLRSVRLEGKGGDVKKCTAGIGRYKYEEDA